MVVTNPIIRTNGEVLPIGHKEQNSVNHCYLKMFAKCWSFCSGLKVPNLFVQHNSTFVRLIFTFADLYYSCMKTQVCPWWRHQMETFSALLALCEGIHRSPVDSPHKGQWQPVAGGFPSQRPVTRNFNIFFDLCLNRRLSKQSRRPVIWDAIALIMTSP